MNRPVHLLFILSLLILLVLSSFSWKELVDLASRNSCYLRNGTIANDESKILFNETIQALIRGELDEAVMTYERYASLSTTGRTLSHDYVQAVMIIFNIRHSQNTCGMEDEEGICMIRQGVFALLNHLIQMEREKDSYTQSIISPLQGPIDLTKFNCSTPLIASPDTEEFRAAVRLFHQWGLFMPC